MSSLQRSLGIQSLTFCFLPQNESPPFRASPRIQHKYKGNNQQPRGKKYTITDSELLI
ncbi:hypothetical protein VTL71DRAFT_15573 [Oculimacula yallundae]|uniref:Uncharacterized protein n=1 Tax=Oculimacula yallundae TaxID=86028 RepID=A0ABR4CHQ0_9HELO